MRRSSVATLLCTALAFALVAGTAQGAEPHPHVGKLPGFPAIRGVVPVLGSKAAVGAREKLVNGAFAAVRAEHAKGLAAPVEHNEGFLAECENEALFFASQDVCYRGGPVLRDPTVHLIFWQGPVEEDISTEPNVKLFPPGYVETVKRYIEDIAHDSGAQTNVFAVDPQYFDRNAKGEAIPGQYALSFDESTGVTVDNTKFPKHLTGGCTDESEYSKGPCLLDSDIQGEVEKVAGAGTKGLGDVYLLFTPPGVGGCLEEGSGECAFRQYCAYHGDFGGDGVTPGTQTLYAYIPDVGEAEGCDSTVHPNGAGGVDAAIDDVSHELNETITDPIGSQCESGATNVGQCERNAWTDVIGQEVADKCLPPESTIAGTYGESLGELIPGVASSAYNQLIGGDPYFVQRVWSNEAGLSEGACVQRAIGASFSVSPAAAATVPLTLDGSASGAPGDPAVYWVWSFEGGEQVGSASPRISHTFAQAGAQEVGLTAYDAYGNAQGTVELVNVGSAPIPSPPPPSLPPAVEEVAFVQTHFTVAQVAATLGLPANGKELAGGSGKIALGHVPCPPACAIVARLYAKLILTTHGRRTTKLVPIGSARLTLAAKGVGALGVKLSASGRALLRKRHRLSCQLRMTVEGQEGGAWQIVRRLTLRR